MTTIGGEGGLGGIIAVLNLLKFRASPMLSATGEAD